MADQQQDQDRSEEPTPFKLREAKRKGQVSKSMEMNSAFLLWAFLGLLYVAGEYWVRQQLVLSRELFARAHLYEPTIADLVGLYSGVVQFLISVFWPLLATVTAIAIASNLVQTGPVFSLHPIKPDVKRLDPVAGFKRVFSLRMLFEAAKTLLKLSLVAGVAWIFISAAVNEALALLDRPPHSYPALLLDESRKLMFLLLCTLVIVALLDLAYVRWDYLKRMRMSRRELKDEHKQREGDPHVRARQRELRRELGKRSGGPGKVPGADMLVTNPTHLAVALLYERGKMNAPHVIAKGSGEVARRMRELARQHRVPVVRNPPLARALFKQARVDEPIPEALFPVVAKLLVWVYAARGVDNRPAEAPV